MRHARERKGGEKSEASQNDADNWNRAATNDYVDN